MSMLDGILGNLDDIAAKLGLPREQVQTLVQGFQQKVAGGTDHLSALTEVAQENGLSLDSLQGLLGNIGAAGESAGEGAGGLLGKLSGALDKDGDGNPLNDLAGMAKGLFGKT
ncbi:MAG TPA: hypothetical protein VNS79_15695 [Sphingobium sp.]|nr:hypothetical protein [Sphingobium sp.]